MARGKQCTVKMKINGEMKEFTYSSMFEARQAVKDYKARGGAIKVRYKA